MNDRTLWYFAHPYVEVAEDTAYENAEKYNYMQACERSARLIFADYHILCPILQTHHTKNYTPLDECGREYWLQYSHRLLLRCDGLIFAPGAKESFGCEWEIETAQERNMYIMSYEDALDIGST